MTTSQWNNRGREVYALRPARGSARLTTDDAVRAVVLVLSRELRQVPEAARDAAIDAAAEGYLRAHAAAGGSVASYPPPSDPGDPS